MNNSNSVPLKQFNEFQPFNDNLLPVLPVPYEALPDNISPWVSDVSSRVGCAPDFLATSVITVLSSLLGRKVAIKPKQYHDWEVIPNLWGAFVGTPSTKKSPAMNEAIYYINFLEAQARIENKEAMKMYKAEVKLFKIEEKDLEKKAKDKSKKGDKAGAIQMLADFDADSVEKPPEIRFICHDTTVEKLAVLMQDNPNGLLTIRDEIAGLLSTLDREEKAPDRAFYLQMFNGNQAYSYDRISRDSVNIPHCVGSVLGGIQPAVLKPYLTASKGKSEDGLLQRIQLIVYPDPIISTGVDKKPDHEAKEKLTTIFEYFANLPPTPEGEKPQALDFTQEAQALFFEWENENTIKAKGEDNPAIEAHLSKYGAFVCSLALIIHLADNQEITPVSNISLLKAIGLTEYFESHARRIYGMVNKPDHSARSLAGKLDKLNSPFIASDFRNNSWTGLTTSEQRIKALNTLIARGYISEMKQPAENQRKPVSKYYINPLTRGE